MVNCNCNTVILYGMHVWHCVCLHSANDMYMKRINILWRAQTYRLGFLRRKERFVNRFLRIMEGWFLASGILCCNFVFEIRKDGADGSAQAGGNEPTGWERIFEIIFEGGRMKEELGSGRLRRGRMLLSRMVEGGIILEVGWRKEELGSCALRAIVGIFFHKRGG